MRYDASRPVPWARLVRLFLVYAVIANLVFLVFFREDYGWGAVVGTVAGGAAYLAISSVLVKLGWDPPILRARANARDAAERAASEDPTSPSPSSGRSGGRSTGTPSGGKPPPTKRTNAGNPKAKKR